MKASPLLRAWLERLRGLGVIFHGGHRWVGFSENAKALRFETSQGVKTISAEAALLALGGGSWPKLGSDAAWVPLLAAHGVTIAALKPANCGFDVTWSEHFKSKFDGAPLKTVVVMFKDLRQQGEFIITKEGLEGGLIYALSAPIRDEIQAAGGAVIHLDLAPGWTQARLAAALARPRGSRSTAAHLEKTVGLRGVKTGLLWEFVPRDEMTDPQKLSAAIKSLPVPLIAPRPLEEAISSAGGVAFESLDERLMLKAIPSVFCAGEMLDWEAPTGGYLLTACLATGRWAAQGIMQWGKNN